MQQLEGAGKKFCQSNRKTLHSAIVRENGICKPYFFGFSNHKKHANNWVIYSAGKHPSNLPWWFNECKVAPSIVLDLVNNHRSENSKHPEQIWDARVIRCLLSDRHFVHMQFRWATFSGSLKAILSHSPFIPSGVWIAYLATVALVILTDVYATHVFRVFLIWIFFFRRK